MDRADQIRAMAAAYSGKTPDSIDPANLFGPGRIEGDDADEFWQEFSETFAVDLTDLRHYLHYNGNEPPIWRTALGVDAAGRRLPDIPIGLTDLVAAANSGRWSIPYPAHRLRQIHLMPWLLFALAMLLVASLTILLR